MKRVLSLVLPLIIVFGVITGMDVSVFATTENPELDLIDIDIYKAQCFLGIVEDTQTNTNAAELCHSKYKQYIEEEALSPTQKFLDKAYADDELMASFALWKIKSLSIDSSTIVEAKLEEIDYYEALITSIIFKKFTEDDEDNHKKAFEYTLKITDGLCNACDAKDINELYDKFPDVSIPQTGNVFKEVFTNNPELSGSDVIDIVLGASENVKDAIERFAAYNAMASLDKEKKQWLEDMYYACDKDTPVALKDALFNLMHSSYSFAESCLVEVKATSFELAGWVASTTINTTMSIAAASNPLTLAILTGLKLGKTISDVCFGTSEVCEQFFMLECIYDVQLLTKKVAVNSKNRFLNFQTKYNAKAFLCAVDLCFESIINTDIDCMISFLDTLYNGGVLKGLITWMYGATDDYQEVVSSLESLREVRKNNYSFMGKCFELILLYNHRDTYDYYFVEEKSVEITDISFSINRILPVGYPAGYADLIVGDFANLNVRCEPSNTTQTTYVVTSDNPGVVEINDGIMTAVSAGTSNITVTSLENPDISYTALVRVGEKLEDIETEGITNRLTYTVNGKNEATITGLVSGYSPSKITIPSKIDGYVVKSIKYEAFDFNSTIESVTIPSSVISIGKAAFYKCSNLTFIKIPDSVTSLGDKVFQYCPNLKLVIIGDSVTSIGEFAFQDCISLSSIVIPNSVTSIGRYAFSGCEKITSVTIPDSVTSIGDSAFWNCSNLISVSIPNRVKNIGQSAFQNCTKITSITIPDSVKSVGDSVFQDCKNLEKIIWNAKSVESIYNVFGGAGIDGSGIELIFGDEVEMIPAQFCSAHFNSSPNIKSVIMGNKVISIGIESFRDCINLTSIAIPNSVISIGNRAFFGCINLKSVTISSGVTSIGSFAFGFYYDGSEQLKISDFIIYGTKGTTAETYANNNNFAFESLCNHKSTKWITDKKATVNAAGKKHKECTVCGEILETATIKQLKCFAVTLSKVANVTTGIRVYWSKVTGADSYRVYRKVKGGSYKAIGSTTKAYYTDKTAKSGTTYYYSVRAINEAGLGAVCKTTKSLKCLADPTLKVPTSTRSGITLKWTKTTGASGYVIYRKAGNGSWKKLVTEKGVSNLSYVDKTAKKGTTYTYKVRAYYGSTYSAYSKTRQIKDKY